MADFNSVQFAKRRSLTKATDPVDVGEFSAEVRVARADYVGVNTLAQNDRVVAMRLPAGARVLSYHLIHGAFGTSVTADIGTDADEDAIAAALNVAAAGVKSGPALAAGIEPLATASDIFVKFEAANPADDQGFTLILTYAID